ncbi:hypothetical protein C7447_102643 [Tenacibaculum adriaticum]|uniref:Uncharacterized protein n=1 Tax=Tenacibaculum adriaticum TaxID=413713 RepID=A0A5S5DTU6_9FLAO|nr:hypothetical protein [Tenacibaculum adriaticum]TYP99321.1 hypothetical protein C7447_102643 [Tenacibaculum adriaticum]
MSTYLCSVTHEKELLTNKILETMRNLILSAIMLSGTMLCAQTDKMVTTKVKKETNVSDNGVIYNTKVKVVTEKTKNTQFDPAQKHQLNQDRVASPVSVTKTVMIDNDMDPFYDKTTQIKYYNFKGKKYGFHVNKNSLLITYRVDNKDISSARAIKSKYNNYYVINGKDFNGVGYFNKDNDFVVEYYDQKTDDTEIAVFEDLKL